MGSLCVALCHYVIYSVSVQCRCEVLWPKHNDGNINLPVRHHGCTRGRSQHPAGSSHVIRQQLLIRLFKRWCLWEENTAEQGSNGSFGFIFTEVNEHWGFSYVYIQYYTWKGKKNILHILPQPFPFYIKGACPWGNKPSNFLSRVFSINMPSLKPSPFRQTLQV